MGEGGVKIACQEIVLKTMDPCNLTIPGRSRFDFHRTGRLARKITPCHTKVLEQILRQINPCPETTRKVRGWRGHDVFPSSAKTSTVHVALIEMLELAILVVLMTASNRNMLFCLISFTPTLVFLSVYLTQSQPQPRFWVYLVLFLYLAHMFLPPSLLICLSASLPVPQGLSSSACLTHTYSLAPLVFSSPTTHLFFLFYSPKICFIASPFGLLFSMVFSNHLLTY